MGKLSRKKEEMSIIALSGDLGSTTRMEVHVDDRFWRQMCPVCSAPGFKMPHLHQSQVPYNYFIIFFYLFVSSLDFETIVLCKRFTWLMILEPNFVFQNIYKLITVSPVLLWMSCSSRKRLFFVMTASTWGHERTSWKGTKTGNQC